MRPVTGHRARACQDRAQKRCLGLDCLADGHSTMAMLPDRACRLVLRPSVQQFLGGRSLSRSQNAHAFLQSHPAPEALRKPPRVPKDPSPEKATAMERLVHQNPHAQAPQHRMINQSRTDPQEIPGRQVASGAAELGVRPPYASQHSVPAVSQILNLANQTVPFDCGRPQAVLQPSDVASTVSRSAPATAARGIRYLAEGAPNRLPRRHLLVAQPQYGPRIICPEAMHGSEPALVSEAQYQQPTGTHMSYSMPHSAPDHAPHGFHSSSTSGGGPASIQGQQFESENIQPPGMHMRDPASLSAPELMHQGYHSSSMPLGRPELVPEQQQESQNFQHARMLMSATVPVPAPGYAPRGYCPPSMPVSSSALGHELQHEAQSSQPLSTLQPFPAPGQVPSGIDPSRVPAGRPALPQEEQHQSHSCQPPSMPISAPFTSEHAPHGHQHSSVPKGRSAWFSLQQHEPQGFRPPSVPDNLPVSSAAPGGPAGSFHPSSMPLSGHAQASGPGLQPQSYAHPGMPALDAGQQFQSHLQPSGMPKSSSALMSAPGDLLQRHAPATMPTQAIGPNLPPQKYPSQGHAHQEHPLLSMVSGPRHPHGDAHPAGAPASRPATLQRPQIPVPPPLPPPRRPAGRPRTRPLKPAKPPKPGKPAKLGSRATPAPAHQIPPDAAPQAPEAATQSLHSKHAPVGVLAPTPVVATPATAVLSYLDVGLVMLQEPALKQSYSNLMGIFDQAARGESVLLKPPL